MYGNKFIVPNYNGALFAIHPHVSLGEGRERKNDDDDDDKQLQ